MNQPSTPDDPSKRPLSEQGSSPETRRAAQTSVENSANDALGRAGTHPLGTAIGGIGGAMAGAVAGIAAGPVGSLAGAIAGALGGAALGSGSVTPPATGPVVESSTPTEAEAMSGSPAPEPVRPASPELAPGDEAAPGTPATGEDVCPACGGTGREAGGAPCTNCEGSGKVTVGIGGA